MAKILLAGGSGFIGTALYKKLSQNHDVRLLSRTQSSQIHIYQWDPSRWQYDVEAFRDIDVIINLTGASIAGKRWTKKQKERILLSRTQSVQTLRKAIKEAKSPISHFISTSATGYYGNKPQNDFLVEKSYVGTDFLANICKQWEYEVHKCKKYNVPTSIIRTSVVLDTHGGALPKMLATAPYKFLGIPGRGNNYMSSIHIDDLVEMFSFIVENKITGIFNACATEQFTYNQFYTALKQSINSKLFIFHIPAFVIQILLGEMSSILLTGNKISNTKIKEKGFNFSYDNLDSIIKRLKS